MTAVRGLRRLFSLRGNRWGTAVIGLGVVLGVVEIAHLGAMSTLFGIALEAALPLLGAATLVVIGYLLSTERYLYDEVDVPRVVGWIVVGMVGMAVIFLWLLAHQRIRGGTFHHAHYLFVNNLVAGGLVGAVVGTYDARSRTYRRSIQRERLKHDFLNRELRHHVRNGMNVILGHADRLAADADASGASVATIQERGEEIVERIGNVQTIARAFTEEETAPLARQNLSTVLRETAAQVKERHDRAVVSADVPDGVVVWADDFLPVVFENLLSNAVEHEESSRARVSLTVDGDAAVVRIADDGPGIPDRQKEALFTWREPKGGDVGMGVGLAMVTVLVDRYGGRVRLEDNDPTGTVAFVELDRADRSG